MIILSRVYLCKTAFRLFESNSDQFLFEGVNSNPNLFSIALSLKQIFYRTKIRICVPLVLHWFYTRKSAVYVN